MVRQAMLEVNLEHRFAFHAIELVQRVHGFTSDERTRLLCLRIQQQQVTTVTPQQRFLVRIRALQNKSEEPSERPQDGQALFQLQQQFLYRDRRNNNGRGAGRRRRRRTGDG